MRYEQLNVGELTVNWCSLNGCGGDIGFGDKWYVDGDNGSNGNSGKSSRSPLETIVAANASLDTGGRIIVWPHQYIETETIAITKSNVQLIAAQMGPRRALTRTEIRQYGNVDTACISVEGAHNVEIAGFRITPYASITAAGIQAGQVSAPYGLYIHDNYFYGVEAAGSYALLLGTQGSFDCDSAYVSHNDFWLGGDPNSAVKGIIQWNSATRGYFCDNIIGQDGNNANSVALYIYDAAAFRLHILDNRWVNVEVGLTGSNCVAISNPVAVGGDGMIDGNHFINYAGDNNCMVSHLDQNVGLNYLNEHVIAGT